MVDTIDHAKILLDIFIAAKVPENILKTVLRCNPEMQAWQLNLIKILKNEKVSEKEYAYIIYKAINNSKIDESVKKDLFNLLIYKKNLKQKWFTNLKKYSNKTVAKRQMKNYTLHPFYAKDKTIYSVIDSGYIDMFFDKNYENLKKESIDFIISLIQDKNNFHYKTIRDIGSINFKKRNEVFVINENYVDEKSLKDISSKFLIKKGENNTYQIYNFIDFKINKKYYLLIDDNKKTTTVHLMDAKISFSDGKINFHIVYSCGKEAIDNVEDDCSVERDTLYLENLNLLSFHHYLYYTNLITSKIWNKNA